MLTLSVSKDKEKIKALFEKCGIEQNENSLCLVASDKEKDYGFSLFDITKEKMVVKYIEPLEDLGLADGILRSTLHIACERFVMNAYYAETLPESFLEKLSFIKSKEEKRLNVDKLFMSCRSCNKEG